VDIKPVVVGQDSISHLKKIFWPNLCVEPSFQLLDIPEYACGLKLGPALTLAKILFLRWLLAGVHPRSVMDPIKCPIQKWAIFVLIKAAAGNPRRTPSRAKRAIYGWTLVNIQGTWHQSWHYFYYKLKCCSHYF